MNRQLLLVGISTAAVTAGTAAAQSTSTIDAKGNAEVQQCLPDNSCDVDNQASNNDRNFGFIRQISGRGNSATIWQTGDDNSATVQQEGNGNSARISHFGNRQTGYTAQSGDQHMSYLGQQDEHNSATVTQAGIGNISKVGQGVFYEPRPYDIKGSDNQLVVSQTGSGLVSEVLQGRGIGQMTSDFGSGDSNQALVLQSGTGSFSRIQQITGGSSASVRMFEGGANLSQSNNGLNRSYIDQDNDFYASDGAGGFQERAPGALDRPLARNLADVAIRGRQNLSIVTQNGIENIAVATMSAGGTTLSEANNSSITQTGAGNFAEVASGSERNLSGTGAAAEGQGNTSLITQGSGGGVALGTNHRANVYQRGVGDRVQINQSNNSGSVTDSDGTLRPNTMSGDQDGSIANVSQLSFKSTVTILQRGSNTAIATQGANRTETGGRNNSISIDQTDAGDFYSGTMPWTTSNQIAQRNFAEVTQYGIGNTASVTQNATGARATVFQTLGSRANVVNIRQGGVLLYNAQAVGLVVDVTQRGSGSTASINQAGQFLSATVNQSQTGSNTGDAGSVNLLWLLQLSGDNSVANVTQDGAGLSATVEQRGDGTPANPNRVTVVQTGRNHTVLAVQEATSGASGSAAPGTAGDVAAFPRARAAGPNSAEIEIMQSAGSSSGIGNSATVRQQGLGQLGIVVQAGRDNVAGILQGSGATNAVAIIEQTGDGNTFYISQTEAGQYMRVTQTGAGNISSTSVSGGSPPGGSGGTTRPAGL